MVSLVVMAVLGFEEQLLGHQVDSKGDCRDAEPGEGALEAVPSCEGARVSPCLTVGALEPELVDPKETRIILSCPWVSLCAPGSCGSLLGVEAREGGALCQ